MPRIVTTRKIVCHTGATSVRSPNSDEEGWEVAIRLELGEFECSRRWAEDVLVRLGWELRFDPGGDTLSWKWIATIQIVVAGLGSVFLLWICLQQPLTLMRTAGLGLAIVAFGLWAAARIQLGKSFSVKPKAVELVSHGIYSKIRNPIYVFSGLWIAGFFLAVGKPKWLLVLIALFPTQVFRARREARVLEEKFGDAYRAYRSNTWF